VHSLAAAEQVKEHGARNDLVDRIAGDAAFGMIHSELATLLDPARHTGRAGVQVDRFLAEHVEPLLAAHHQTTGVPELKA
jgi:adenylosuccinate lyase